MDQPIDSLFAPPAPGASGMSTLRNAPLAAWYAHEKPSSSSLGPPSATSVHLPVPSGVSGCATHPCASTAARYAREKPSSALSSPGVIALARARASAGHAASPSVRRNAKTVFWSHHVGLPFGFGTPSKCGGAIDDLSCSVASVSSR